MFYLDLILDSPAHDLALDEALLDWAEFLPGRQVLRTWQPGQSFVVVGYGNEVAREVHTHACHQQGIPILRRCTGGGTVLQGPGCLNYTLVLNIGSHPDLQGVATTNCYIMERNRAALESLLGRDVSVQGHTDLVIGRRKFSGNAQRRGRRCLLFHGTFLLSLDPAFMEQLLPLPSRQPGYRQNRAHANFLAAIDLPAPRIVRALREAWHADQPLEEWPRAATRKLVEAKYSRPEWSFKR